MPLYNDIRSWVRRTGSPITIGFLAVTILLTLYGWVVRNPSDPLLWTLTMGSKWYEHPWSLFTYPFVGGQLGPGTGVLFFLLFLMWFFYMSSSVERDLGKRNFVIYSMAVTGIGGLLVWATSQAVHISTILEGPTIPIGAMTVAWATRYPTSIVMLFGLIPVQAKWIGVLAALGVLVSYGTAMPLIGVAASVPVLLSYLYASNRLGGLRYGSSGGSFYRPSPSSSRAAKKVDLQDSRYFEDVKQREKTRQERERLRKLFESSLDDDGTG